MWITGEEAVGRYYIDNIKEDFIDDVDDGLMYNLGICKIEYNTETKVFRSIEYSTVH